MVPNPTSNPTSKCRLNAKQSLMQNIRDFAQNKMLSFNRKKEAAEDSKYAKAKMKADRTYYRWQAMVAAASAPKVSVSVNR